jgi:hypothetical protein
MKTEQPEFDLPSAFNTPRERHRAAEQAKRKRLMTAGEFFWSGVAERIGRPKLFEVGLREKVQYESS